MRATPGHPAAHQDGARRGLRAHHRARLTMGTTKRRRPSRLVLRIYLFGLVQFVVVAMAMERDHRLRDPSVRRWSARCAREARSHELRTSLARIRVALDLANERERGDGHGLVAGRDRHRPRGAKAYRRRRARIGAARARHVGGRARSPRCPCSPSASTHVPCSRSPRRSSGPRTPFARSSRLSATRCPPSTPTPC